MKKILLFLSFLLMSVEVWGADVIDTLTASDFAATKAAYVDFSNVSKISDAIYAGQSAKDDSGNIQLRSKDSNSGVVSTTSGGIVKSVKIIVGHGSNTVNIYGSNTAYTSASDLYDDDKKGTKIGSITSTGTITFTGNYTYVGIRSNNNAIYLSSIEIIWKNETPCDSISVFLYQTENGSAELNQNKICSGDKIEITNITPDPGYILDTIISVNTSYSDTVGLVDMENHKITNITKDCIVLVLFKPLPPEPEIEIVEWNPDYIKVDINNFNAATALLEDKDTQHTQEENIATELFFSKYFEASGENKLLAIYNGTKDTIKLDDYRIVRSNKGSSGVNF